MVFHRGAQVETWLRACVPRVAVVGFYVRLDCTSDWREGLAHVVVGSVGVRKC